MFLRIAVCRQAEGPMHELDDFACAEARAPSIKKKNNLTNKNLSNLK